MEWTVQDLGAIGEFIGAIGVIVTLVYLAYQIRQNTAQLEQSILAAQVAATNASNLALRQTRQSLFESADMTEIYLRGNKNPLELSDVQLVRYRLVMQNVTEVMLEIYTQTWATNFSPETWTTQGISLVKRALGSEGGRWFWENYADNYPALFRSEVENILAELHVSGSSQ